jgi:hypothetical protein
VTGVGSGASPGQGSNSAPPSSGSTPPSGGTGGSVEIEVNTCGLPGEPPCKIDETGTPTGAGADASSRSSVETESAKLTDGIAGAVTGTGAPNASTSFFGSLSFPTNCTPFSVGNSRWGTHTVNFCAFQPIVHDLMSIVWVFFTILASLSMVFRTMNTSGA